MVSGLAGLVARHTAPGVYTWRAAFEVPDVRHTVEHAGWRLAYVDGWTHSTKAAFLVAAGEALVFPAYYGANLDALRDCLWDVPGDTVLLWDGWGPMAREDAATFSAVLQILRERAAEEPAFAVLLRGDGPPLEVSSLEG